MEPMREEINLLDYWRAVVRRRWTVGLIALALGLFALLGSFTLTPLYRGTATIQIERRNPDILTFRDVSQIDYSWAAYADFYQTQYKIIASEPVARRTVERLGLLDHPEFESDEDEGPGLRARLRALLPRRLAAGPPPEPRDLAAARILAALEVAPVRNSHLVKVAWTSPDPDLAALVANGVAEAYIQLNMQAQFSTSGQAEEFLVDQIGALKREIEEIETRLQSYGESKRIVSIDESSNITLQALKDISERRTAAQTQLAAAQATYSAVVQAEPEALPEVLNSSLINALRGEYAALEAELGERSKKYGTEWPGVRTLRSKLEQAAARLDQEIETIARQVRAAAKTEYDQALNEVQGLDRLLTGQESAAQRLKRDAIEFANLQSEVQKKRETLDALIARQNEMALSTRLKNIEATSSNIRIIERAKVPNAPFRPNVRLNLMLGLVFGLLLGIGLALLLDHVDNTIGTAEELRRLVPVPVLAVVPRHGESASPLGRVRRRRPSRARQDGLLDLVAHRDAKAGASEAYRDLRTSILLSNPGRPPRKIVVTSTIPEEGKTATATNLAIVLAQLGTRVLLVDTDLRRPRLHRTFDVPNRAGISNCLSGLEEDPTRVIVPTGVERLDLLPSGPIPPNPSELLNSPTFLGLCERLIDSGYDHVVFDSPPVLSVSDPVILASTADTWILVVRAGRSPRQSVRLAVEKLRQAGDVGFGLVLNDLDLQSTYAYYGQRYAARETDDDSGEPPQTVARGGA